MSADISPRFYPWPRPAAWRLSVVGKPAARLPGCLAGLLLGCLAVRLSVVRVSLALFQALWLRELATAPLVGPLIARLLLLRSQLPPLALLLAAFAYAAAALGVWLFGGKIYRSARWLLYHTSEGRMGASWVSVCRLMHSPVGHKPHRSRFGPVRALVRSPTYPPTLPS